MYVTINSFDLENLRLLGMNNDRFYLLPNAVDCDFFTSKPSKDKLLDKIKLYAKRNKYNFYPKRKILLAPVKVMRRKNIIESILILKILNSIKDEYQLLVTLDANSPEDMAYSELIKDKIKDLPVVIGFGKKIISSGRRTKNSYNMVDVFSVSEAIITTSIIEGFGFAFHEAWLADKPVIGRKLPMVTDDFEENGLKLDHMYEKLKINVKHINVDELKKRYYMKINQRLKQAGIADHTWMEFSEEFNKIEDNYVDFADLDAEQQLKILDTPLKEILNDNPQIKQSVNKKVIQHNKKAVLQKYNLHSLEKRMNNYFGISKRLNSEKLDNVPLIDRYMQTDNIRLLQ
jgi:glycosyltransferase involved in cell wall biosynthesis